MNYSLMEWIDSAECIFVGESRPNMRKRNQATRFVEDGGSKTKGERAPPRKWATVAVKRIAVRNGKRRRRLATRPHSVMRIAPSALVF